MFSKQNFIKSTLLITIITIIAQLLSLAYSTSVSEIPFSTVVLKSAIALFLITLPCVRLGLFLGQKLGFSSTISGINRYSGTPLISQFFNEIKTPFLLACVAGVGVLLLRAYTKPYLPNVLPDFGHRGILGGLAVSFGAAVAEEVWFRFGLMTLIIYVITRAFNHNALKPLVVWPVIIFVSFSFGLAHLPQLMSYGAASNFAIWGTIIGNSLVGSLYGWCYWRKGLIAAIIAHFTVDIVIHVLPAMLN